MGFTDTEISGLADRLVDALVPWGDADTVAAAVSRQLQAGTDHVAISVTADAPQDQSVPQWRQLAERLIAARSGAELDELRADRDAGYEWIATHDEDWRRALDFQAALWRGGHIRAVGFPDLLVAAVAERERLTVIHYDADYDLITEVTGQPVQWIVPRGTVP
jgi:predicted nucleic acid-binding protein